MTPRIGLLVFLLVCSHFSFANDFDNLPEVKLLQEGMPKDVASFIPRVVECNHFGGEEAYNKERAEFLSRAVESAGCGSLGEKETQLREKYKDYPKVLEVITKAKDLAI